MKTLETNKTYKDQKKKEKEIVKKKKQIEANKLKRLKIKEKKEARKVKKDYDRYIKKCRRDNPTIAKMIAKIRDKRTCQKCNNTKDIHWSHIINEARDHRLACDPDNIKALCYNCHMNWRHKNPVEAGLRFRDRFPWRWERLQEKHLIYNKLWTIEHQRIEDQNKKLRIQYKTLTWEDWK